MQLRPLLRGSRAIPTFCASPTSRSHPAKKSSTKLAAVVPAELGWSDVESWSAVWDVLDHDPDGNALERPVALRKAATP